MNLENTEIILGLLGTASHQPFQKGSDTEGNDAPLVLDALTEGVQRLCHALEEHNRIAKVQNEALKVLADQGVTAWHQMAAVMQMIWSEHTKEQRRQ